MAVRRQGHGLELQVGAGLVSVDLQEHVTDAQGRALAMGNDDLHFVHVRNYPGMQSDRPMSSGRYRRSSA